jgi:hypothetical protein
MLASKTILFSFQGVIKGDPENESQSGAMPLESTDVATSSMTSNIVPGNFVTSPAPTTSSTSVPSDPSPHVASSTPQFATGGSALAAAMMSGSSGTVTVEGSAGSNQTAALTMVSSTTVTGTSVTGIPTTISVPPSAVSDSTTTIPGSYGTSTTPSSATSTATVRAGGVAAHSAAPAATAVAPALSRPGSVTAVTPPVPTGMVSDTTSVSSSAAESTVNSASSSGRFSASLSSASARVRRMAAGTNSFKVNI